MSHLVRLSLVVLLLTSPANALPVEDQARVQTALITFGPGTEVWELFGHNALQIQDPRQNNAAADAAFNYGLFSFGDDFVSRFIFGTMRYWMAPESTPEMLRSYHAQGRSAVVQHLSLDKKQSEELADFLWTNALPENRHYTYNYFRDNCSTRIRDALDRMTGGELKRQTNILSSGRTYRWHTRRIMQQSPLLMVGVDYLLGQNADIELTRWEEMYLPQLIQEYLREVTMTTPGGPALLVQREERLFPGELPPIPSEAPGLVGVYGIGGLLIAALVTTAAARRRRWIYRIGYGVLILWTMLASLAGALLLFITLFTDHWAAYRNENLFYLGPLSLLLLLGMLSPSRLLGRHRGRILAILGIAPLVASLLGLAMKAHPAFFQENWNIIALALPANAAVAMILSFARSSSEEGAVELSEGKEQP